MPRWGVLLCAVLGQVMIAVAVGESSMLGLAHAVALVLIGMYGVLKRDLPLLLCVLAYLTGAEVMWRQATTPIPYLSAPYLMFILSTFAVVVVLRKLGKDARLALLYIALLVPASISTIRTMGPGAREAIAFALSGPFALAAFVAFTSQVRVAPWLYRRVLWTTLISALGPWTIAVTRLRADYVASGGIEFNTQSNFQTSGGFGPVQVSSVLSIGILCAVLLLLSEPNRIARWIAGVAGFALFVQTLLTFSRGGSFAVAIAVIVLAVARSTDGRSRRKILAIGVAVITLSFLFVFPWLESFTGGAFQERFSDQRSSRTDLAANDTQIFRENLALGVGPGMTKFERLGYEVCQIRSDACKDEASSHTEFTRMLGEHGLPGVAALIVLSGLALNAYRRHGAGRAFGIAFLAWSIAQMFYANLRITAVPFAFGMAFLRMSGGGDRRSADDPDQPDPHSSAVSSSNGAARSDAAGRLETAARGGSADRWDIADASGSALGRPAGVQAPQDWRDDRPVGFGAGYSLRPVQRQVGFGAGYGRSARSGLASNGGNGSIDGHHPAGPSGNDHGRNQRDGRVAVRTARLVNGTARGDVPTNGNGSTNGHAAPTGPAHGRVPTNGNGSTNGSDSLNGEGSNPDARAANGSGDGHGAGDDSTSPRGDTAPRQDP